jgi:PBP1b-binding outer membrane lipoprotein LpoB
MQRKSALARIEAVIVVGLLLAGCAPAPAKPAEPTAAPTATVSEALRRDAERMAEEMGISVEEALRRARTRPIPLPACG